MKKEYVEPKMRILIPAQEDLMDFPIQESEAGGDFEFAKEQEFEEESLPKMKSVWDDEF